MLPGRTTVPLVTGIMAGSGIDPNITDITPFIDIANELVTEVCAAPALNYNYSTYRLEMIERWLSAHFVCMADPRTMDEGAGVVHARYESKVGYGLRLSRYGQQAMIIDTAGALATLDKSLQSTKYILPPTAVKQQRKVGIIWLGQTAPGVIPPSSGFEKLDSLGNPIPPAAGPDYSNDPGEDFVTDPGESY